MKRQTVSLIRYHVRGTQNYCVALYYRDTEFTPKEKNPLGGDTGLHEWVPADAEGIEKLKAHAKKLGFTHVRMDGDWDRMTKPKGGKL